MDRVRLIASQVTPTSLSRGVPHGDSPVYRLRNANRVEVKFTLRNDRTIGLSCMHPATFPPCPTPEPGSEGAVC